MLLSFVYLLALNSFAQNQPQSQKFDNSLIQQIQFKQPQAPPPEYMPDTHTSKYRAKSTPIIKTKIQADNGDIMIGLEGLPSNLSEINLINKLQKLVGLRVAIDKALQGQIVPFHTKVLVAPRELAYRCDLLEKQLVNSDHSLWAESYSNLKLILTSQVLATAFTNLYVNEKNPEILAPGLSYYVELAATKARFFGMEQDPHYLESSHIISVIHAMALSDSIDIALDDLNHLKPYAAKQFIKPLEQPLNDIAVEAKAWVKEISNKYPKARIPTDWPPHNSPQAWFDEFFKEDTSERSKDWVKSYEQIAGKNKNDGVHPRILMIGGYAHATSLRAAFKNIGIEPRVLPEPE